MEDDKGCTDTMIQSFTFTVKPVVSFSFIGSMPLCKGDSIDITASGEIPSVGLGRRTQIVPRNYTERAGIK